MTYMLGHESYEDSHSDTYLSEEKSSCESDVESSCGRSSEGSSQIAVDQKLPMSPAQAAAIIQGLYRRNKGKEYFVERARQAFERVYDEEYDMYFFYNKTSGKSQWTVPRVLLGHTFNPREEWAARKVQGVLRKRRAWIKVLAMLNDAYEREYDPETDSWFYVNKVTKQSTWEKPTLFGEKEPPTNAGDAALFDKDMEIKQLKKELERHKSEAEEAKNALNNKIVEERVKNGKLDPDEAKGRSKHMDEWDVSAVVEWFRSIGYVQYDTSIREHQVDGLLLLHLINKDWSCLGITSQLTARRIEVAMQPYRLRFEHKQAGGSDDSDHCSDVSGSDTPSDLEDDEDIYGDGDHSDTREEENLALEDDHDLMAEEELLALRQDEENIKIEVIFEGDKTQGRPSKGDVVRIHYTCTLEDGGSVIESSRRTRRRPFEFAVGTGQVVRGIDRSITKIFYGERARVSVTPFYGYGDAGRPPLIPPGAALIFDVDLLDFWPRPRWRKPLIQVSSEPYEEAPYVTRKSPPAAQGTPGHGDDRVGAKSEGVAGGLVSK